MTKPPRAASAIAGSSMLEPFSVCTPIAKSWAKAVENTKVRLRLAAQERALPDKRPGSHPRPEAEASAPFPLQVGLRPIPI